RRLGEVRYRGPTIAVALVASLCACFRHAARTSAPTGSGSPPPAAASALPPAPAAAATEGPAPLPEPSAVASPGPSATVGPPTESPRPAPVPVVAGGSVQVEMKNVYMHMPDRVVLMIHSLRGALLRTAK